MTLKGVIRRLRPNHLAGQITLLILASIVTFQAIVIVMFHVLDVEGRRHVVDQGDFIASVILALDIVPPPQREKLLLELSHATPYANISIRSERPPAAPVDDDDDNDGSFSNEIRVIGSLLWNDADVFAAAAPESNASDVLAVALRNGGYALVSIAQHQKPPRSVWRWLWQEVPGEPFILTPWARAALSFLIFTTVLVFWASNGIVAPLIRLARHAEQFPSAVDDEKPLVERGPSEIRELTRSINRMQARIRTMITSRAHILAAVSHDLRTIITRLKLRSEFIADKELQRKMLHDIDLMGAMLYKNLQHLRAESGKSDHSLLDLDSILQTVSDQFGDMGYDVSYRGGHHQMVVGSLTDLQRVFTNLVENAAHHATTIEIRVEDLPTNHIQIDVVDNGPGIAAENKESVFEPFVRGKPGRTIDARGGFGLGLSIVRSIVEHHGGSVRLLDHEPNGLIARVILPCGVADDAKPVASR